MCVGSHRDFEANCRGKPPRGSFVRMAQSNNGGNGPGSGNGAKRDDLAYCRARAVCVALEPGDLCVWDSRTVHCSSGVDTSALLQCDLPPHCKAHPPGPGPGPGLCGSSAAAAAAAAAAPEAPQQPPPETGATTGAPSHTTHE